MLFKELAVLNSSRYNHFSIAEYKEILDRRTDSEEFEPKLLNGEREKRIDDFDFNELPIVDCERLLSSYGSVKTYFIEDIGTTFSTNRLILLLEIVFPRIIGCCKSHHYMELENDVPTEVTIVKVSGPTHSGEETDLDIGHTNLKPKENSQIALNKPIFIKAGFMYEIRMKQSPPAKCFTGALLKSKVKIQPDLIVQFHNVSTVGDDEVARGLIRNLMLVKI